MRSRSLFYGSCRRSRRRCETASSISTCWSTITAPRIDTHVPAFFEPGRWRRTSTTSETPVRGTDCAREVRGRVARRVRARHARAGFIPTCGAGSRSLADCSTQPTRSVARARGPRHPVSAVTTFAAAGITPRCPPEFDAEALWTQGLLLTYAAELRSERPERIRALYANSATEFRALTERSLEREAGISPARGAIAIQHERDRAASVARLGGAQATGQRY